MKPAAAMLALLTVPFAVLAGVQRAEAPQTSSLSASIAGAFAGAAVALWVFAEVLAWRRGRRAGGSR